MSQDCQNGRERGRACFTGWPDKPAAIIMDGVKIGRA